MLTDDDFLYLQENCVVMDGIFKDENIIFDNVTLAWKDFCDNTLLFEIPVYEPLKISEPLGTSISAGKDNGKS